MFIGQIPVVRIVHVHPADLRFRRFALVIVNEYRARPFRHRVIILVPYYHGQSRRSRHRWCTAIRDGDRDIVALPFFPIELDPCEQVGISNSEFRLNLVVRCILVYLEVKRWTVLFRVPIPSLQFRYLPWWLVLVPNDRIRHI